MLRGDKSFCLVLVTFYPDEGNRLGEAQLAWGIGSEVLQTKAKSIFPATDWQWLPSDDPNFFETEITTL